MAVCRHVGSAPAARRMTSPSLTVAKSLRSEKLQRYRPVEGPAIFEPVNLLTVWCHSPSKAGAGSKGNDSDDNKGHHHEPALRTPRVRAALCICGILSCASSADTFGVQDSHDPAECAASAAERIVASAVSEDSYMSSQVGVHHASNGPPRSSPGHKLAAQNANCLGLDSKS